MNWLAGGMARTPADTAANFSATAARRTWTATVWLVAFTIVVAVSGYSLSLKVASERQQTEQLARANHALETDLKALDAELRVRMRMPQLQSWNDRVLGLVPISASQYLQSPLRLADYGRAADSAPPLPKAQYAVRDEAPKRAQTPESQPAPRLARADAPPRGAPRAAPPPEAIPAAILARATEEAPADLLQQVRLVLGAPTALAP